MKVKVSETVEVTDWEREKIGETLGKKQASRDECREYIWRHGADWAQLLHRGAEYDAEGASAEFMGSALGIEPEDDAPIPGMELI